MKTMDHVFFPFGLSLLLCWDPVLVRFFYATYIHTWLHFLCSGFEDQYQVVIDINVIPCSCWFLTIIFLFLRDNVAICIDTTPNDDFRNFASSYCCVLAFSSHQPVTKVVTILSPTVGLNFYRRTYCWTRLLKLCITQVC